MAYEKTFLGKGVRNLAKVRLKTLKNKKIADKLLRSVILYLSLYYYNLSNENGQCHNNFLPAIGKHVNMEQTDKERQP